MKITNVILLEVIVEGDKMNEVLLDTLIDTLKLIPFLFLAFELGGFTNQRTYVRLHIWIAELQ